MGKVVIDYEGFKEVLRDYLAENLINEMISAMHDTRAAIKEIKLYKNNSSVRV